jgi:carbonic anhydrase
VNIDHPWTHVLLTALITTAGVAAHSATLPWSYTQDATGPDRWAELDPAFEACSQGSFQSPIDIRNPVKATLPALQFGYHAVETNFVNNGRTVLVQVQPGQSLTIGDQRYELLQIDFHTPSEEAFNGKRAEMVAHFIHRNAVGQLGVVAVLLQAGKPNAAYDPVFAHLPRPGEKISVEGLKLELGRLLPAERIYYTYAGSLTTPPCSEGVQWMVMRQTVNIGTEQIKAFQKLFKANARPVQALNGRSVRVSD